MKYLVETNLDGVEIIQEAKENGEKDYFISGIFMEADNRNRNGRIYPKAVMEREVERYLREYVDKRRSMGELNHPEKRVTVDPERASHLITELKFNGNQVYGKAKILSTPVGQVVKALLKDGVQLGVSSRGFGTIKESKEGRYVQDDFRLMTVDIVSDPSCAAAFVESIMESKEFYYENGILMEKDYSDIQTSVKKLSKRQISEGALLNMFEDFMNKLK